MLKPNLLGDLRAEADSAMLGRAFLPTPDYRTLIETSDRILVVGRRGTGKSAIAQALDKHWRDTEISAVRISPDESQIIGVRPLVELFGEKFNLVRAGTRLLWRFGLMMETALVLEPHSWFNRSDSFLQVRPLLTTWKSRGHSLLERTRSLMRSTLNTGSSPEERIGDLPAALDLTLLERALVDACHGRSISVVFLIDKLDEGYEPDHTGIGLIDGLVQAAIDLKTKLPAVRPVLFLRDNMLRALQIHDPDYSRNIEGHVLRLHWDERDLFDFTTARMKVAFNLPEQSNLKIWNQLVTDELRGREGFSRCLQLTLYRPRDVLALLNQAFYFAQKMRQTRIAPEHIEATAKSISQNRLDDLLKEYSAIVPSLAHHIGLFQGRDPKREINELTAEIERSLVAGSSDTRIQQDFFILEDSKAVIRGLYSVGFLGVPESASGRVVFCHDGRAPDREFSAGESVLVHPCYWMALNCTREGMEPGEAEDIYDEYDIEVASETPDIRRQKITALIDQLDGIPEGAEGDAEFETWCHKAIRIVFAKSVRNVELKANKNARQRRDVVGTILAEEGIWRRIRDDYGTRQVVFEIKNYKGLGAADYQQILSYLNGEYGRLAFAVTRDESVDLYANRDVEWVRDMYASHRVMVVKLTGTYLRKLLYKLRNPRRHDDVNDAIHKILDTYSRLYLAGQTVQAAASAKRLSRKKLRKERARRALSDLPSGG